MPGLSTHPRTADWRTRRLLLTPRDNQVAAVLLGVVTFGLWTWWALGDGAFFGTVLLPGAVLLYMTLALVLGSAHLPVSTRGPHAIALAALVAFAAWTLLSMLWTPARDLALDYAQRSFVYAAAFAAGLLMAASLRRRMLLAAAPALAAAVVVTAVLLLRIWTADTLPALVDSDGTLDFPLGYRNANAGFFLMIAIGAIAFAARPLTGLGMRSFTLGLAATALSIATISQSRGSVIGAAAGVAVLLAATPWRGRTLIALGATVLPVALMIPQLLDAFDAAGEPSALAELQAAAAAAAIAGALAALLAVAITALERRAERREARVSPRTSRILIAGTIAAGVIAIGAFAVAGPLGDAGDSLSSGETDYEAVEGSRFTYGGGLDRTDFWSVAADQTLGSPLGGEGAGSFRSRYLLERDSDEAPRNAHSIWLETSGELGLIGLLLLVIALAMGVVGALRSRKLGPEAAALSTIALAVGGAWLGQASVDWSWFFGALTAPTLALLGAAAAPAALSFTVLGKTPKRLAMGTAALLCLIAIPTFASERLVLQASRGWPDDLEGAYSALDTAADLNPFADTPLLVESEIARRSGDPGRALEAAEAAAERDPEDWRARFLAAKALALYDPDDAYAKIDEGLALNPRSEELSNLLRRLDRPPASE